MVTFPAGYPMAIALVSLTGITMQAADLRACVPMLAWIAGQLGMSRVFRGVVLQRCGQDDHSRSKCSMSLLVDFYERTLKPNQTLLLIMLTGFVARAICAIWFRGIIDGEGAEYARIAQNLLSGVGYVGIATGGKELVFPPLFPFLIAAVTLLTGDAEVAGRIVSVATGSLVVVPVYLIAQKMYGERVAIPAAILTGLHPFLVQMSSTVFCEATYLTIVLFAIYMAMRAMDAPSLRNLFGMGVLYGLAYLVRQEALAYAIVGSMFVALQIAVNRHRHHSARFATLTLVALGFLLVAGPYTAWLSLESGNFECRGKAHPTYPLKTGFSRACQPTRRRSV